MFKIPKSNLSLLNNLQNNVSFPQSTIDTVSIDEYDKTNIIQIIKLLLNRMNHFSSDLMTKKVNIGFEDIDFVRFTRYSLVATYNIKTGRPIVNMQPFGRKEVTNIESRSLYASIFYAYLCKLFTIRPLKLNTYPEVSTFLSNVMVKMFGKRYGILASYEDSLPKLQFLTTSYVLTSFYGEHQKNTYLKSSKSGASKKDFSVDLDSYDLSNVREYIKLLSDSNVFPGMVVMNFADFIINRYGLLMLPFFEDEMRFMATIGASSMPTGGLFPPYLEKFQPKLYERILKIITTFI